MKLESMKVTSWDERRDLLIPGDQATTLDVCVRHFVSTCKNAIKKHGSFSVALLAGGSTPKAIYERLCSDPYRSQIPWEHVHLFWSDERNVPPEHPDSNYKMVMEAGFSKMPIPKNQIHRMEGEDPIEEHAENYNLLLNKHLTNHPLDLVILGMGEDGHTASLFPQTDGLKIEGKWAIANYIHQKNTWRMTLTYEAINSAENIVIYVLGESKKQTIHDVFKSEMQPERYPIQNIGTKNKKALWIIDDKASSTIF